MSERRQFAAKAREWFRVAEYEPGVHLVAEPGHVCSWLIHGSERSALLDTGLGIADISEAIASVASSPPFVVNSHTDFDHVGGNALFDHVEMHELGPEQIEEATAAWQLREYERIAPAMEASFAKLLEADREDWFLIGPDEVVRPWPAQRVADVGWGIDPSPEPARLLADGDAIALGDRTLRVIHTPGHAPEHICLVDEAAGILFAQDQLYYGPQLIYEERCDLGAYASSLRRLADELTGSIRAIYVAHCLRPALPPRFMAEIADAAESVAAGEAQLVPSYGLFDEPVLAAEYGYFSILVPEGTPGRGA